MFECSNCLSRTHTRRSGRTSQSLSWYCWEFRTCDLLDWEPRQTEVTVLWRSPHLYGQWAWLIAQCIVGSSFTFYCVWSLFLHPPPPARAIGSRARVLSAWQTTELSTPRYMFSGREYECGAAWTSICLDGVLKVGAGGGAACQQSTANTQPDNCPRLSVIGVLELERASWSLITGRLWNAPCWPRCQSAGTRVLRAKSTKTEGV